MISLKKSICLNGPTWFLKIIIIWYKVWLMYFGWTLCSFIWILLLNYYYYFKYYSFLGRLTICFSFRNLDSKAFEKLWKHIWKAFFEKLWKHIWKAFFWKIHFGNTKETCKFGLEMRNNKYFHLMLILTCLILFLYIYHGMTNYWLVF